MQTIQNILKIAPSGAVLSDQYGSTTGVSLEIMLGTSLSLEFDLREESAADNSVLKMYPLEKLISGAYYCAFDTACKYSDSPLLLQISGITLSSDNGKTVFAVNIPDTAVEKMITALAGRESLQMFCEIGGISPEGKANFAWHFPVTVRNRIFSGNGEATIAGDPEYYTSVQVEAAISRPLIYEYSADARSWRSARPNQSSSPPPVPGGRRCSYHGIPRVRWQYRCFQWWHSAHKPRRQDGKG